ncbi:TPA: lytic transglycosylase domain-containing protein [Salmonella enterica]|nr:lytic transglycosylase domain-containing protein [Salmonella enterica]
MYKLLFLFFLTGSAQGSCYNFAGEKFGISPKLLKAISLVESNNKSGIVSKINKNGTYDIGIMQINSSHLRFLKSIGINESTLLQDSCTNVIVGAYLLRKNFIYFKGDVRRAIGAYNAGYSMKNEGLGDAYVSKVFNKYKSDE